MEGPWESPKPGFFFSFGTKRIIKCNKSVSRILNTIASPVLACKKTHRYSMGWLISFTFTLSKCSAWKLVSHPSEMSGTVDRACSWLPPYWTSVCGTELSYNKRVTDYAKLKTSEALNSTCYTNSWGGQWGCLLFYSPGTMKLPLALSLPFMNKGRAVNIVQNQLPLSMVSLIRAMDLSVCLSLS